MGRVDGEEGRGAFCAVPALPERVSAVDVGCAGLLGCVPPLPVFAEYAVCCFAPPVGGVPAVPYAGDCG